MLQLQHISWIAPDGRRILNDINLDLPDGRLIAVSGPNGGGKTTLAKILAGIERPSSGHILLNGEDITNKNVTERARLGLSFGFQQPVRFKGITVRHLLSLATGDASCNGNHCMLLRRVGLCCQDYIDRDIDATLSGGEIKRIEIASVLARNAPIVILDEPEAGIDLWSFEKLISVFEQMKAEGGRTMVIISHQERILKIADEIVLLADGGISDRGPGPEMLDKMLQQHGMTTRRCGLSEVKYHE